MNKILSSKRHIMVFILPTLIFYVIIVLVPLIISAYYSMFDYDGISAKTFIGLSNYIKMFIKDPVFSHSLLNVFILMAASLGIQFPLAFFFANTLAKGVRGEKFFRTTYFIPVVISSMVIGRLWMSIFNSRYGLLNHVIEFFGFTGFDFPWLTNPKTAFITTVVPAVWQYIGYHMLIMYAGIKSIPKDYFEAANIDGATGFKLTRYITIPVLAPVLKTCTVFSICGAIKSFDLIFIMTGGGPNKMSHVPATLMYENLFKSRLYGYGSAQAFFIVIACLVLSLVVNKLFKRSLDNLN